MRSSHSICCTFSYGLNLWKLVNFFKPCHFHNIAKPKGMFSPIKLICINSEEHCASSNKPTPSLPACQWERNTKWLVNVLHFQLWKLFISPIQLEERFPKSSQWYNEQSGLHCKHSWNVNKKESFLILILLFVMPGYILSVLTDRKLMGTKVRTGTAPLGPSTSVETILLQSIPFTQWLSWCF